MGLFRLVNYYFESQVLYKGFLRVILLVWMKVQLKRGTLGLSVNAIVILILAIAMLALGIGFVDKMFGSASNKAEEAIASAQVCKTPATPSEPLTVCPQKLKLAKGEAGVVSVGVYAAENTLCYTSVAQNNEIEATYTQQFSLEAGEPRHQLILLIPTDAFTDITVANLNINCLTDRELKAYSHCFSSSDGYIYIYIYSNADCGVGLTTCNWNNEGSCAILNWKQKVFDGYRLTRPTFYAPKGTQSVIIEKKS